MKYPLLEKINSPDDLKSFPIDALPLIAKELRARIIEVMSINGGHLASNLGSVEILLAMHYVFDSPNDKMIFDTSHQIYAHKILTGRNDLFPSTRQYKGLSGFCAPCESPHDHFYSGHAATALSSALGVATARDLNNETFSVLPFICDAPFACGLTFEALNNIPKDIKNFTIVLNDNAWAISSGVGCFHHNILGSYSLPRQIKGEAKEFFSHFHLDYIGPIDGHDVKALVHAFKEIRHSDKPIILHALTIKGYGMDKAIEDPTTYHGAVPFDPESGKFHPAPSPKITFPKIFGKELLKMGKEDNSIVAITPAMPRGSCLDAFMQAFPERSFDVGIAEGHAVTFAGGLAYQSNKKVLVSIYSTFFQRAFDNVFQDVCLQKLPVVFTLDRAGFSPRDGSTHHGIFDIGFLKAMPQMVIVQPRDGDLLKDLLYSCFKWKKTVAIRYPNMTTETTDRESRYLPLGKGEILKEGKDVAIIALGHMHLLAFEVCSLLEENGIYATVVDPIFVKPLDRALLYSLLKHHKTFVTIEEHSVTCGLSSCINSFLAETETNDIQILNFGIPDEFIEHGSYEELMSEIGLTKEIIANRILKRIKSKNSTSSHLANQGIGL